jgi:hypothetical protein
MAGGGLVARQAVGQARVGEGDIGPARRIVTIGAGRRVMPLRPAVAQVAERQARMIEINGQPAAGDVAVGALSLVMPIDAVAAGAVVEPAMIARAVEPGVGDVAVAAQP